MIKRNKIVVLIIALMLVILLATVSACSFDNAGESTKIDKSNDGTVGNLIDKTEDPIDKSEDPIDKEEKFYKLAYSKAVLATFAKRDDDIAIKVSTLDQLNELVNNKDSIIFNESSEDYNKEFSDRLKGYDTDYFRNKSLIVVTSLKGDSSLMKLKDIDVKDSLATVILKDEDGEYSSMCVMTILFYIIEADNSAVADVNEIAVEKIRR